MLNDNRFLTETNPDLTISTYSYAAEGLRRSRHEAAETGQPVHTIVWDGSDYLGEY